MGCFWEGRRLPKVQGGVQTMEETIIFFTPPKPETLTGVVYICASFTHLSSLIETAMALSE